VNGLKTSGWELDPDQVRNVMRNKTDDELCIDLGHSWPVIRHAAEAEAAARWSETIMPRGE
jgi:hypothetical protein